MMNDGEVAKFLQEEEYCGNDRTAGAVDPELLASELLAKHLQNQEDALATDEALAAAMDGEEDDESVITVDTTEKNLEADAALAAFLQHQQFEDDAKMSPPSQESPATLQTNDMEEASIAAIVQLRQQEEDNTMMSTADGRATLLAQRVIEIVERLTQSSPEIQGTFTPVGYDDMVFLAKNTMDCQETFQAQQKPTNVTVGYHYTSSSRLDSIRQLGLMSGPERRAQNINAGGGGAAFGQGIYTSNNPFGFQNFGDNGLLVAILKGMTRRIATPSTHDIANTVVGNKHYRSSIAEPPTKFHDEIVVKTSSQCLPLIRFPTTSISQTNIGSIENQTLWQLHVKIQEALDLFFNGGVKTTPIRVLPPGTSRQTTVPSVNIPRASNGSSLSTPSQSFPVQSSFGASSVSPIGTANPVSQNNFQSPFATAPTPFASNGASFSPIFGAQPTTVQSFPVQTSSFGGRSTFGTAHPVFENNSGQTTQREVVHYQAPATLTSQEPGVHVQQRPNLIVCDEKCAICLGLLSKGSLVETKRCKHMFHDTCIEACLKREAKCPVCRLVLGEPQGRGPSGTMTITPIQSKCPGFGSASTIQIHYNLKGGVQLSYHVNPGQPYGSVSRNAYLPDNAEGRKLLRRLKYAFERGLSFSIGTSMTTGAHNVITWSSIHHKTSLGGGPHGFPDPNYMLNCNEELDALSVPKFD